MYKPILLIFGKDEVDKIAGVLTRQGKYQVYKVYSIEEAIEIVKKKNKCLYSQAT